MPLLSRRLMHRRRLIRHGPLRRTQCAARAGTVSGKRSRADGVTARQLQLPGRLAVLGERRSARREWRAGELRGWSSVGTCTDAVPRGRRLQGDRSQVHLGDGSRRGIHTIESDRSRGDDRIRAARPPTLVPGARRRRGRTVVAARRLSRRSRQREARHRGVPSPGAQQADIAAREEQRQQRDPRHRPARTECPEEGHTHIDVIGGSIGEVVRKP